MSHSTQSGDAECLAKCGFNASAAFFVASRMRSIDMNMSARSKSEPDDHGMKWNLSFCYANCFWKLLEKMFRSIVHHRCDFVEDSDAGSSTSDTAGWHTWVVGIPAYW